MKPIYFSIVCTTMAHPYMEQLSMRRLSILKYDAILASTLIFLLPFLHISET